MGKVISKINTIVNNRYFIYLWLFALSILNFGILIPTLGFYWDDLPYLFQYSAFGPGGFPAYVASDRPFSAWIFTITTALFGYAPMPYHVLILILRWFCAVLLYLILREIWPDKNIENTTAATIFAIYPGFMQQPIALIYNHHFSVFAMFLASLFIMTINLKRDKLRIVLTLLSAALTFSMFSIENFAMLELIRPFIIWKILKRKKAPGKASARAVIINWLPYLAVFILFLVWRVFIFKFPTYRPAGLAGLLDAPVKTLGSLIARIPRDFYTTTIRAWAINLYFPTVSDYGRTATFLYWGVIIFAAIISFTFFLFIRGEKRHEIERKKPDKNKHELLIASVLLFLFAGIIIWGLDLPVENKFAWDRMTLAFIPGVALLGASLFSLIKKSKAVRTVFMTSLVILAVSQNYQNAIAFKRDWDNLQDFFTQLSWRIPALAENTIFITSKPGLSYYSDNSLTSPINLQYADDLNSKELDHFVYYTHARSEDWFENDVFNQDYKKRYRSFIFYGNTGNAITYRFEPPSCVQILDWKYANSITTPNMNDRQVKEVRFTNLDLILASPEHPPFPPLFTPSEPGSWCYYFEKADLARQFGKFEKVVELGNQAIADGKFPRTPSEWLPFLEGFLWEGNFDRAKMIMNKIIDAEGNYTSGMCYTLNRIGQDSDFPYHAELNTLITQYECTN